MYQYIVAQAPLNQARLEKSTGNFLNVLTRAKRHAEIKNKSDYGAVDSETFRTVTQPHINSFALILPEIRDISGDELSNNIIDSFNKIFDSYFQVVLGQLSNDARKDFCIILLLTQGIHYQNHSSSICKKISQTLLDLHEQLIIPNIAPRAWRNEVQAAIRKIEQINDFDVYNCGLNLLLGVTGLGLLSLIGKNIEEHRCCYNPRFFRLSSDAKSREKSIGLVGYLNNAVIGNRSVVEAQAIVDGACRPSAPHNTAIGMSSVVEAQAIVDEVCRPSAAQVFETLKK